MICDPTLTAFEYRHFQFLFAVFQLLSVRNTKTILRRIRIKAERQ